MTQITPQQAGGVVYALVEVTRLGERVGRMEARELRLILYIYRLEGLMRSAGIEPPPFDPDNDTVRGGVSG